MSTTLKRLAVAIAAGLTMCLVVWLNLSEMSPAYHYLREQPDVGYGVLVLNLPALFISRILSGTPPAAGLVYLLCFLQWFGVGLAASSLIWRNQGVRS